LSIVVRPPVVPSVLVANGGSGTVTDYPLSPTGNVAPLFTLGQGNKLSGPSGVAVDSTGRVYVVNSAGNTVSARRHRPAPVSGDTAGGARHDSLPLVADARAAARRPASQPRRIALRRPAPTRPPVGDDRRHRRRSSEDDGSPTVLVDRSLPDDWTPPHLKDQSGDAWPKGAIELRPPP
jgi:hypothetical protein